MPNELSATTEVNSCYLNSWNWWKRWYCPVCKTWELRNRIILIPQLSWIICRPVLLVIQTPSCNIWVRGKPCYLTSVWAFTKVHYHFNLIKLFIIGLKIVESYRLLKTNFPYKISKSYSFIYFASNVLW